jgi:hypothetical protein
VSEPRLYTLGEAALRLGVTSPRTVRRRLREAGVRPAKPGRSPLLTEADIQILIEQSRERSPAPETGRDATEALRAVNRRRTKRLTDRVHGQVVALALGRR